MFLAYTNCQAVNLFRFGRHTSGTVPEFLREPDASGILYNCHVYVTELILSVLCVEADGERVNSHHFHILSFTLATLVLRS